MVRAVVAPAKSATNIRMPSSTPRTHATRLLIELLDTHHVQILGPQAHGLQDKEAPKVRGEASIKAHRHSARIITTAAIAESRRSHRLLHAEDVRPGVGDVSAV